MKRISKKVTKIIITLVCLLLCIGLWGCDSSDIDLAQSIVDSTEDIAQETKKQLEDKDEVKESIEDKEVQSSKENKDDVDKGMPEYKGKPYVAINNNIPKFKDSELKNTSYETYARLDNLGRCGIARANIGRDLMPTSERGSIGRVKPSGWQTVKYDIVDGKYLYNRCHLIGFQLTGENANERNLITGTRYMNVDGMLPFENMVADYIKETSNHVLYQVEPIYEEDNLVATGVHMQGKSVEDKGKGISFNVFVFNVQPGVEINYKDGTSSLVNSKGSSADKSREKTSDNKISTTKESGKDSKKITYVLNTNTNKFHKSGCASASTIVDKNKGSFTGNRKELIDKGYEPCKKCNP